MLEVIGIISFLITLFALWAIVIPYTRVQAYKRPDAQISFFPLFGYVRDMLKDFNGKGDIKASIKTFRRDFPNCRFKVTNILTTPVILLRDPELVKELAQKYIYYDKSKVAGIIKILIGSGLVLREGEEWKRHRKIISASFNYDFLKENVVTVQNIAIEFINKITLDQMQECDILLKAKEMTGEVIGRLFFGAKLNSYTVEGKMFTTEFAELTEEVGELVRSPFVLLGPKMWEIPFGKFKKAKLRIMIFRNILAKVIADRKAQSDYGNDLLGLLLATQKSPDPESVFSDQDIADEFATFFLAGMDTTAHLVVMLLYCLAKHPEYQKPLADERATTYNIEDRKTCDMLQKMNVLHAMCKETLRMYAPFPSIGPKMCIKDHILDDLHIRKGDLIEAELLAMSYDEKVFKDPFDFEPNRWLDPNFKHDPFAFIPFSAGPKNCIGQNLAMIEAKVIISELLNRFDFKLKDENYKLKMTVRMGYEAEQDILFKLTPKV